MERSVQPGSYEDLFMHLSYYFIKRASFGQKRQAFGYLMDVLGPGAIRTESVRVAGVKLEFHISGDLATAKRVLMTPFDTPRRAFHRGYVYTPFDDAHSRQYECVNTLVMMLRRFVPGLAVFGLAMLLPLPNKMLVGAALLAALVLWQGMGEASAPNFNKSTATLALLLWMAKEKMAKDTAYIFIDHCAESPAGLKAFLAVYKDQLKGKRVLYLDCLADGETVALAQGAGRPLLLPKDPAIEWLSFHSEALPGLLQTDPQLYVLFSGKRVGDGLEIVGTRTAKDCKIDIKRLKAIAQWLARI